MKPEKVAEKKLELNENEKLVFETLQKEGRMLLSDLKASVGLSNKQWDKSLKGLAKLELTKVEKTEEGLFIQVL